MSYPPQPPGGSHQPRPPGGPTTTPTDRPPGKGRWGTGPKVLTWVGAVLLGVGLAAGAFGMGTFVDMLPVGIVTADGEPGPRTIGGGDLPGSVEVDASQGDHLVIWQLSIGEPAIHQRPENVTVTGPNGDVRVIRDQVRSTAQAGEARAQTFAEFEADTEGGYLVEVDAGTSDATAFAVSAGASFEGFFSGIFSTMALWLVAITASPAGLGLLVAGIAWGTTRARRPALPPSPGLPPGPGLPPRPGQV